MTSPTVVAPSAAAWTGLRVLVTGHTGFKGAWLVRWLRMLGAEVHGLALDPPTQPSLFDGAGTGRLLASDHRVDLRDAAVVRRTLAEVSPAVVLHLAAQSLVRTSYREPAVTFATNVTGTANLLDAVAATPAADRPRAVLVVTSDKVYRPDGGRAHLEGDVLGGDDPYSASKAMCEAVVTAFRHLHATDGRDAWDVPMATARAGNVIGGGDWADDRLVPDCIRALRSQRQLDIRYPGAVRPWQHVLEPLSGYLLLAERLLEGAAAPEALNLGPGPGGEATVAKIVDLVARTWGGGSLRQEQDVAPAPENPALRLDAGLARAIGWRPRWTLGTAVEETVRWYRAHADGADEDALAGLMEEQVARYVASPALDAGEADR